jgi:hypothetical protein
MPSGEFEMRVRVFVNLEAKEDDAEADREAERLHGFLSGGLREWHGVPM